MANLKDKIKRYINDMNDKSIGDKYDGFIDLIDSFLDGNQDFYLSTYDEYSNDELKASLTYDDFTKKAIYRFINEFEELYPGFLPREEIISRIKSNLKYNIYLEDLSDENLIEKGYTDDASISAYYNPLTKKIYIDKNLTSAKMDSALFHEFLHCITIKNDNKYDLNSEFITETVVTCMQEKFEKTRYNTNERCNNYITNYIKQLEVIFGRQLYREYIRNYRDISNLFNDYPVKEYSNKMVLHNYVLLFNKINKIVRKGGDEFLFKYANTIYDFNTTLFLNNYLKNHKELSNYEKLKKIDQLLTVQKTPDIDLYSAMINDYSKDGLINSFPNLRYIKDKKVIGPLDELLKEKIDNYNSAKEYGFTAILDYRNNPMFAKQNVFFSYPSKYYSDYLKKENYYNLFYKLKNKYNICLDSFEISEVCGEYQNNSLSMKEEMRRGKDYSNEKLANYRKKNLQLHEFLFKAKKGSYEVFVEGPSNINIYTKSSILSIYDKSERNSEYNKLLANLLVDGVNNVYISSTSKDIIVDKDDDIYKYTYKSYKKSYDLNIYTTKQIKHSIDTNLVLKKKI
jgi:hypothetical protein